jgi:uncharacterized membrane protein HdeD (DUF308 family)
MGTEEPLSPERVGAAVAKTVRQHWQLFLIEGIALVILGLLAIAAPAFASNAATIFFGWLLLISGSIGLIATFRARHAPGFVWALLSALLALAAGVLLIVSPLRGTFSLTAVLIAFLLIEGVVSIAYALEHRSGRSGRWGWVLASGVLDLVLGGILFAGLPGDAFWALGLLIGINMVFGGWSLIAMALHARPALPALAAGGLNRP